MTKPSTSAMRFGVCQQNIVNEAGASETCSDEHVEHTCSTITRYVTATAR